MSPGIAATKIRSERRIPMGCVDQNLQQEYLVDAWSSEIVAKALHFTMEGFKGRFRKVPAGYPGRAPKIPYHRHCVEVALTLGSYGYPPWVVAAGLMHDHVEDLTEWNGKRLFREFKEFGPEGKLLASTVLVVTKPKKELDWKEALQVYVEQLTAGSPEARAIAAADKVSNMQASRVWAKAGFASHKYLAKGWEDNYEKFARIGTLLENIIHPLLYAQYMEELCQWREYGILLEFS